MMAGRGSRIKPTGRKKARVQSQIQILKDYAKTRDESVDENIIHLLDDDFEVEDYDPDSHDMTEVDDTIDDSGDEPGEDEENLLDRATEGQVFDKPLQIRVYKDNNSFCSKIVNKEIMKSDENDVASGKTLADAVEFAVSSLERYVSEWVKKQQPYLHKLFNGEPYQGLALRFFAQKTLVDLTGDKKENVSQLLNPEYFTTEVDLTAMAVVDAAWLFKPPMSGKSVEYRLDAQYGEFPAPRALALARLILEKTRPELFGKSIKTKQIRDEVFELLLKHGNWDEDKLRALFYEELGRLEQFKRLIKGKSS